jgi:dihydroflavonol-4-reductase
MRVLVTGATGFVGGHLTRLLVGRGHDVLILVRPSSNVHALADLPVTPILGNLTDPPSLERAVQGIDLLFHVAADYRLWVPDPHVMHEVNVGGTVCLLQAAWKAGVGRMVYTSSAVTVACSAERLGTEEDFLPPEAARSAYQRTKILAEQAVWDLIRNGAPITVVNPSTPIGALDHRPTPTGRLIVDFLTGRLPAFVDAELNWIDIADVAAGHWLAADKGRPGERYILGHRNMMLGDFLRLLAEVSGRRAPRVKIPYAVAYAAGAVGELWGRLGRREPRASLDGVRMAGSPMRYDSAKAVKELGLPQSPIRAAMEEAVRWFRTHGYVTKGGAA